MCLLLTLMPEAVLPYVFVVDINAKWLFQGLAGLMLYCLFVFLFFLMHCI